MNVTGFKVSPGIHEEFYVKHVAFFKHPGL
jgi:hypothetical protein